MNKNNNRDLLADFEPPDMPGGGPCIEMGGQAVIEGVMMRASNGYAVAVRKHTGAIKVKKTPNIPIAKRIKPFSWPFVRGAVGLFEMLIIGFKTLTFSVDEWEHDMEEQERLEKEKEAREANGGVPPETTPLPSTGPRPKSLKDQILMVGMFVASFAFAIFLVVALPNLITAGIGYMPGLRREAPVQQQAPAVMDEVGEAQAIANGTLQNITKTNIPSESSGLVEEQRPFLYNLISGAIRAMIIFGYIFAISFMNDVKRLFQYHGAEHKAVSALEHGRPLTVENVQPFSTLHPRCGTTFIFVVMVVSIFFFASLAWMIQAVIPHFTTWPFVGKKALILFSHLLFMPVVAGTSYELLKLSAKHRDKWLARFVVIPGFAFQRITTNEPDDEMVEVSIAAMQAALDMSEEEETFWIEPSSEHIAVAAQA